MIINSLNGNDTFELVSPILVGEAGLREQEKVCWVLELCDVKVNGSCGLHVHIDAAGFSMETWHNLALSYQPLEPVIDRFMPASRRDNYYCRGVGHISDGMIRSARTADELKGRIGNRYHKVNLEAYSRHKTVEFRQHSGTTCFTKMRNWAKIIGMNKHMYILADVGRIAASDSSEFVRLLREAAGLTASAATGSTW